ncbi:asparagine synthetase B family protein [Acidiluteibacter ferrifornacis]|uniref:asparagine synthase (glutamine-hydrolyzing) n=1 Tax=Acidiluteibacter ferrifornacis TaxID=2692424 RepID=A0A6N9NHJ7_9FLAO|nr:asparagine synthase-related protein [Acidiluteibacter ferrifornacis]NBG66148.1 hypothetical protein [Acidiluteibacter ferrifornacis]
MNSIFGIVSRNGAPIKQEHGQAMQVALDYWDAKAKVIKSNEVFCLGYLSLNTKEGKIVTDKKHVLIADATLFNKSELKQKLDLNPFESHSDDFLLLKAYHKWGRSCPEYLNGEFAFVILDQQTGNVYVARDQHGIKPLYYFLNEEYFAFATELKGLLSLPFINHAIDEQYVADFICRIWLDNRHTLYRNIKRFPATHTALFREKDMQFQKYWNLDNIKSISFNREADYIDAFEEKLIQAVAYRMESGVSSGTELSGGLDSSLVSVLLQNHSPNRVSAYSYVLPSYLSGMGLSSDEVRVLEVANYAGIKDVELLTDTGKGMLDSLAWNLKVHDEPPFEFNPLFRDGLYQKLYAKGQRILFSGFGGDEMVSSQASGYIKQLYLEGKNNLLKDEISALSKRKNKGKWLLYSSLYLKLIMNDRILVNTINRFQSICGNASNLQKKLKHRPLVEHWFKELNMEDRFRDYQKRYSRNGNFMEDQIRRMQEPHVAMRLEYQAQAARSFQVEYRYPLLDIDLIEFYLGLPTEYKARNGNGRYIFKKVLERHLPKDYVWRNTKKGSSNPQVLSRTMNDGEKLEERLFSIAPNHPVWSYLDREKLQKNRIQFKEWNQSTTDFVYLMLADQLT